MNNNKELVKMKEPKFLKKPKFFRLRRVIYYRILLPLVGWIHSQEVALYEAYLQELFLIAKYTASKEIMDIFGVTPIEMQKEKNRNE